MQEPLQSVCVFWQVSLHTPEAQTSPPLHPSVHLPQLSTSVWRLTQAPPQSDSPF